MNLPLNVEYKTEKGEISFFTRSTYHCLFCGNSSVYLKNPNFYACVSCKAVWYMYFPLPPTVTEYDSDLKLSKGLFDFIDNLFDGEKA